MTATLQRVHVKWPDLTQISPHHVEGQTYDAFVGGGLDYAFDLYHLAQSTFGQKNQNIEFIIQGQRRITFTEFFIMVNKCAMALQTSCGVMAGDRVAILGRNSIEWIVAFVAAHWIGANAVPMNSWWTSDEIKYGLVDCGAKVVFADNERMKRIRAIHDGTLACFTVDLTRESFHAFLTDSTSLPSSPPQNDVHVDHPCMIMYTSGTTSRPKGVTLTHRGLMHLMNFYNVGLKASGIRLPPSGPQRVILLAVPLFHATGMHSILLASFLSGRKIVIMEGKWSPETAIHLIEQERVTAFTGVPTMVLSMLACPSLAKRDVSSLLSVSAGGAPVPHGVADAVKTKFHAMPGQGFGLTEVNCLATRLDGAEYLQRPGSCGRAIPGVQIEIWNEHDNDSPLPVGIEGRVMLRGVTVMRDYWNQPEATAKAITKSGWFDSGDLGHLDHDGYLYISGRNKELIIRGGEKISCRAVEEMIYARLPNVVVECAVFGIPHSLLGEEVCCACVGTTALRFQDIHSALQGSLAHYEIPTALVVFPSTLPRGATGKIVKRDIKTMIEAGKVVVQRGVVDSRL